MSFWLFDRSSHEAEEDHTLGNILRMELLRNEAAGGKGPGYSPGELRIVEGFGVVHYKA